MAEGKNSILVYRDWINVFEGLTDEEAGMLIKHLFRYVNDMNPEPPNRLLGLVFEPLKQTLKRDLKRYEAICFRNQNNGAKGGRPKRNRKEPKKPSGLITNPNNPDEPDSDSDSDSDIIIIKNKKYVFNSFYDSEIELSENDPDYIATVKVLFGDNDLNIPLRAVLKMPNQLSYVQFKQLKKMKAKHNIIIAPYLERMENWGNPKKNTTVYLTLLTFIRKDHPEIKEQ